MRTPRGHVATDSEVCQHRPVEIRRVLRCSGPPQRLRRQSAATTFLGRTARVRVPPSAAAHSACAWAPLHHHHRRHRLADRGRGLGLVDYCEKSKTFRMMPRSKTSSAWCVSCVGVLSRTGARGRECKRADPHPLNLELDPHSWPPTKSGSNMASFTPEPLTIVHFIQYRPSTAPPRAAEWLASSHTKGLLQPRPREAGAAPRTAGQLEEEQRACGTRERQSHWWDLQGGPVRTSRGRRGHRERV